MYKEILQKIKNNSTYNGWYKVDKTENNIAFTLINAKLVDWELDKKHDDDGYHHRLVKLNTLGAETLENYINSKDVNSNIAIDKNVLSLELNGILNKISETNDSIKKGIKQSQLISIIASIIAFIVMLITMISVYYTNKNYDRYYPNKHCYIKDK